MDQRELRHRLLDLCAEWQKLEYLHHQDMYAEIAALLGLTASRTQMRRALGALHHAGAVRVSHRQIPLKEGAVGRVHVVRFVRNVEL